MYKKLLIAVEKLSKNQVFLTLARRLRLNNLIKNFYYRIFCPKNHLVALSLNGITAQFYAEDFDTFRAIEATFALDKNSEEAILKPILEILKPGDIAYDIGANIGVHSVFMAKKIGPTGRIIAFEPEKNTYHTLKKNLEINALNNVKAYQIALGDQTNKLPLYSQPNVSIGAKSLVKQTGSNIEEYVDLKPGDYIVSRDRVPYPDAVKIDVEGFEHQVMNGLRKTLSHKKCRLLCCEIHPEYLSKRITLDEIYNIITSLGFKRIKKINRGGEIHAICSK